MPAQIIVKTDRKVCTLFTYALFLEKMAKTGHQMSMAATTPGISFALTCMMNINHIHKKYIGRK